MNGSLHDKRKARVELTEKMRDPLYELIAQVRAARLAEMNFDANPEPDDYDRLFRMLIALEEEVSVIHFTNK